MIVMRITIAMARGWKGDFSHWRLVLLVGVFWSDEGLDRFLIYYEGERYEKVGVKVRRQL
jgi:hypothetical protein